ncbi:putative xanthine dehydrogenase subunit C [Paenibacillus sp. CCS19]|uniref:FAD binding domain-containing protein n=1 Tax=Paenibacillus sp. CCS19 TaxID=3158387 RepID=UPI0025615837|nr:FAD binding domain-containing protein [Paenibacillus cellulosilyticus]GMK38848.1 putative xanthine dehydrogenase subunit C [Paenibacillus cellulosilyticus]
MSMNGERAAAYPAVWRPTVAQEAVRLKKRFGREADYVSGGTLLRTQWEAGLKRMPAHLIDLSGVASLSGFELSGDCLAIGSLMTLTACRHSPELAANFPLLAQAARSIAAPSVRNAATIGGNVMSVVGDALPALLAYEAELDWDKGEARQSGTLADWLTKAESGTTDESALLLRIRLPLRTDAKPALCGLPAQPTYRRFACYEKIGRREAFTPSVVTVALIGRIGEEGRLRGLRLAAGGGRTVPKRLSRAETELEGAVADDRAVARLHELVMEEYEPEPDAFASASYRKRTAANVVSAQLWEAVRGYEES